MLEDGTYMTDDEFLSNFCMDRSCIMQLNSLVEADVSFRRVYGKLGRWSSMLHIMVLLKFLPPDWFDDDIVELEQVDELNQSIENSTIDARRNRVFSYMLEGHWIG